MIEDALDDYIREKLEAYFPEIDQDQIMIRYGSGEFMYDRNKSRACLGSERLQAEIEIEGRDYLDRKRLMAAFPRQKLPVGDYECWQQLRRFEQGAHPQIVGTVTFVAMIEYEFDYFET